IGADSAKEELEFFVQFLRNPKRFAALGLRPPKGVLLHGPPGTGKTMLARAMAGQSEVAFISMSASSFVTLWQGSGPQNVRDLFARARRYAPSIVFIDESDAIGKVRTGTAGAGRAEESTLNALLTEMDGFTSPSPDRPVFVLAATNVKVEADERDGSGRGAAALDPALARRFDRKILVGPPDRGARQQYLTMRLEDRAACTVSEEMIKLIAERSTGLTIANLESMIETAARAAARAGGSLTDDHLEEAFEAESFGETRARGPEAVRRTARHEAGHAIMYWLAGRWPAYVTVVSRGEHGGYMAPAGAEIEQQESRTRQELLADIRVCLGGRGAEIVYYGQEGGVSSGAAADLQRASSLARTMICRLGMHEEFGLLVGGGRDSEADEAAAEMLSAQMAQTLDLLAENRRHLDAVVDALLASERLTAAELQDILPPVPQEAGPDVAGP
ncbi:MAG: AAA family ATPase, partial [Planctomycetota bacterium]